MDLTQEKLKKTLYYDDITGMFTWKCQPSKCHPFIGKIAGSPDKYGYIRIAIYGKRYSAHRLAFLYMTGAWPKQFIDHRDGNPANNAWLNLREATIIQNVMNRKVQSNNLSEIKGIFKHKYRGTWTGQWRSKIKVGNKYMHLGLFNTAKEAHNAYVEAAKKFFGEFYNAG